jgi:peptide deformylase
MDFFGTEKLQTMLREMMETLDSQADGVALAAPQVGISYRIFIVRYDRMVRDEEESPGPEVGIYINPTFVKTARKREEMQEGCLSVRGIYGTTLRHDRATVKAQDENGTWFIRGGGGILAQAFQHEIDHLDGILFIDHAEEVHEQTKEEETHATEPA